MNLYRFLLIGLCLFSFESALSQRNTIIIEKNPDSLAFSELQKIDASLSMNNNLIKLNNDDIYTLVLKNNIVVNGDTFRLNFIKGLYDNYSIEVISDSLEVQNYLKNEIVIKNLIIIKKQ